MKYHITHKTSYTYTELVPICHNLVHLAPRSTPYQKCSEYELKIDPAPAFISYRDDCFGNRTEYFSIEGGHEKLEIIAESTIDVTTNPAQAASDSLPWEECVVRRMVDDPKTRLREAIDPVHSLLSFPSPRVPNLPALREYVATSFAPRRPILEALEGLTTRIHQVFKFDSRATSVDTPIADVLRLRRGVCQDFAHLATGCLRSLGLAARYTSGYLRTVPAPGKPRLVGADASHAWCSCWCGPLGWIDFDPTNNCFIRESHVTIGWGRDYGDVCPIQGVFVGGGEHQISVSVDVAPEAAA
jgi:transglutaminase-like putative cysteine protease